MPFVKGKSGNPKGRPPKGHSITETLLSMMDEQPEVKRAIATKIMKLALAGDIQTIKTLWSYLDGMPKQSTDITSDGEKISPLVIYAPEKNKE